MAVRAVEAWKTFLGDENFQKWRACGYAPEEPAQTNEVNVDMDRCLQSENAAADRSDSRIVFTNEGPTPMNSVAPLAENNSTDEMGDAEMEGMVLRLRRVTNEYFVVKSEFERYKAGVEHEKAETERRTAESNAFIDTILQNECKMTLFDENAAADGSDSQIVFTNECPTLIHSVAPLAENNSTDEMGDDEMEGLVRGLRRVMNENSVMKTELERYEGKIEHEKPDFEYSKAEIEHEKAETERSLAELNAFIETILQNECEMTTLLDGMPFESEAENVAGGVEF